MFSKRLKDLRKKQGLKQEQLAEILNVSRQSIGCYENGTTEPGFDTLVNIANIFNVSLDYLLCRTENKFNLGMANKHNDEIFLKLANIINEYEFTKK